MTDSFFSTARYVMDTRHPDPTTVTSVNGECGGHTSHICTHHMCAGNNWLQRHYLPTLALGVFLSSFQYFDFLRACNVLYIQVVTFYKARNF